MTVNNHNSFVSATFCYKCLDDFKAADRRIEVKCGHVYHRTCILKQDGCSSYECQKERKAKQYSQENWAVVKGTVAICAAVYTLNWLFTARK